jgi:hypothetical protein
MTSQLRLHELETFAATWSRPISISTKLHSVGWRYWTAFKSVIYKDLSFGAPDGRFGFVSIRRLIISLRVTSTPNLIQTFRTDAGENPSCRRRGKLNQLYAHKPVFLLIFVYRPVLYLIAFWLRIVIYRFSIFKNSTYLNYQLQFGILLPQFWNEPC